MAKRVDLDIIKRLMTELETTLSNAESITTDVRADKVEFIVEMNKATGLATGIMIEAGLLMGDIQHIISGAPSAALKPDLLEKILGGLKGPGNAN